TPRSASSAPQRAVLGRRACFHELALDTGELPPLTCKLDRGREARPAREVRLVPSRLVPGASRGRQLPGPAERFPVPGDPPAPPGPLADQRLVRDLRGVVAHDQESRGRQALQYRGRLLAAFGQELPERNPPTCVLRRLTELGQLEEHPPHQRLLLRAAA